MKTFVTSLAALAVLAGIALPSQADVHHHVVNYVHHRHHVMARAHHHVVVVHHHVVVVHHHDMHH